VPEDDLTANADISRAVWLDPHPGQATATGEPLTFTNSSNRLSQLLHAYS
jgi:hypothetical protein